MLDKAEIVKYGLAIKHVINGHSDGERASAASRALSAILKENLASRETLIDAQRLMQKAVFELRSLRASADRMGAQLEIVDIFRAALAKQESRQGIAMSEDFVWSLERFIEAFSQTQAPPSSSTVPKQELPPTPDHHDEADTP